MQQNLIWLCLEEIFSIFDPSKLPGSSTGLSSCGNYKLVLLGVKYAGSDSADFQVERAGFQVEDLTSEWESFKHLHVLSDNYKQESVQGVLKALETSESTVAAMYSCLSNLACIAWVLPISTAQCEGCFSAMKRVKTELCNRLVTTTLDNLWTGKQQMIGELCEIEESTLNLGLVHILTQVSS